MNPKTPIRGTRGIRDESGAMLLEALLGILIFSIGILSLVALQTMSIKDQAEAKYRADASYLASRIIGVMWGDRANVSTYQHRAAGGGVTCNPTGTDSSVANMTTWLGQVTAALPGAVSTAQQIIVGAGNQITITICWRGPQETAWHNFRTVTYVN